MIKVLVVDDSAFMRSALTRMLSEDPEIEVVGTARDGEEGLEKVQRLDPDLITLDVDMPRMDGLGMLERLMKTSPKPVLMVSSLTSEGAEATLRAMDLGALDFIPKYQEGSISLDSLQNDLHAKVKAVARRGRFMRKSPATSPKASAGGTVFSLPRSVAPTVPPVKRGGHLNRDLVAIGVSTGGPPAVQKVLSALPANFPACILIAQHMPATFTGAFAKRLDAVCQITVKEAATGDKITPGVAYVCPGGKHLRVDMRGPIPYLSIVTEPASALYKPSANVLMESVALSLGRRVVGVTMTGMGSDGVEGTKVLKQKGGWVIAQNEASCVVYGMPKAVVDGGLANEVVELDALADSIQDALYR